VSRFLAKECTGMEPFPRSRVFLDFHGISREGLKDYPNSIKCFKEDASFCAPPSGSVGIGGQTVAEFWLDLALARYGSDIYLITKLLENVAMCENFKEEKSYDKKRKGEVLHALSKYCSDDASEISLILHQVYANDEDRSKQLADIDLEMNAICSQIQQGSNP
ncbi:MAG: hypothetical protein FWD51_03660, partial [Betaproteobacteria bacterium]|nr:hypothetical protein [Betaproteobacteria bacterium]